jgi:hypothetical protein
MRNVIFLSLRSRKFPNIEHTVFELERKILRVDILCKRIEIWTLLNFPAVGSTAEMDIYIRMARDTVSQSFQRNELICI